MTAPNHAITGALIGLSLSGNPVLVVALSFLSHFVLDAVPHYDPPGDELARLTSRRFSVELYVQALLCAVIVVLLASSRHAHWLLAAICAFVATSPDLLWIPKFLSVRRTHRLPSKPNWFWRLHHTIQWYTGSRLLWIEAVWFVLSGSWLLAIL